MHARFNCALIKLKLHLVDCKRLIINPEKRLAARLWQDSRQKVDRIDRNYKTMRCKYEIMRLLKRTREICKTSSINNHPHTLIHTFINKKSEKRTIEPGSVRTLIFSLKVIKLSSISRSAISIPSLYTSGISSLVVEMLSDMLEAARGRRNGCSIKLVR